MEHNTKSHLPTKQIAAKVIYEALKVLQEAGGELPGKEVTERYEKSGNIRWQSILHFLHDRLYESRVKRILTKNHDAISIFV